MCGVTNVASKETGGIIKCMGLVLLPGAMGVATKENMWKIRKKALVASCGQMDESI